MVFLYRGLGWIVPAGLLASGMVLAWLVFEDGTLGNLKLVGFSCLITAGLTGLVALGTAGREEGAPKGKHDLFFLPLWVWVILLAAGGGVSLWKHQPEAPKEEAAAAEETDPREEAKPAPDAKPEAPEAKPKAATRALVFFNDSKEKRRFIVADDRIGKLLHSDELEPGKSSRFDVPEGSYIFAAFGETGEVNLPRDKSYAQDKARYELVKGQEGEVVQRIISAGEEEWWFMMGGTLDYALVDASVLYEGGQLKAERIRATDWAPQLMGTLDGYDLLAPQSKLKASDLKLLAPGEVLPSPLEGPGPVVMLPAAHGATPSAEEIADALSLLAPPVGG